jgi:hypothetical protein
MGRGRGDASTGRTAPGTASGPALFSDRGVTCNGVCDIVTWAATPLRYGVTGHLAGNQPVTVEVSLTNGPGQGKRSAIPAGALLCLHANV